MTDQNHFSVEKVAKLAKLELSPDAKQQMQSQMEKILEFVDQLDLVDVTDVEPFFGAAATNDSLRPDDVLASSPRKEILDNAPESDGEFYIVPAVFGDGESA